MLSIEYPFDNSNNYSFDNTKIEFSGGKAQLKLLNVQQDFTEDFADDTDFSYDAALAEFSGGKVQQVNHRPTDAVFYASFTNDEDGNWGEGTLAGTLNAGASVSGGALVLSGADAYCEWNKDNVASVLNTGCVRFRWKPHYTGNAPTIQQLFWANNNTQDRIMIRHNNNLFQAYVYDSSAVLVCNIAFSFQTVAEQIYEIELNFDTTGGTHRLFIDGILKDTDTGTGTRGAANNWIRCGGSGYTSLGDILDILIYDTVQHTSNYTPDWSDIEEYDYLTSSVILPEMEHAGDGTIVSFDVFTVTESGSPRYTLQIGRSGNYLYWNGSAWVTSDGTYAQANDSATFNANVGSLPVNGETYGQFKVHFPDSNTQSYVDTLTAAMTITLYSTTNPTIIPNSPIYADGLSAFEAIASEPDSNAVKFALSVDGVYKYWNGSAWATSSGYSQSNTASEINDNLSSLGISLGAAIKPVIYLHSENGLTAPDIDNLDISYNFFSEAPTSPSTCIIWGYVRTPENEDLSSVTITAKLKYEKDKPTSKHLVSPGVVSVTTNSLGYFEIELIRSSAYDSGGKYTFTFEYPRNDEVIYEDVEVPDEISKNFWDLV